jgi:serine/threonine-protein kinase
MDSEYWRKVERVLDVALESDPSSWKSVLDDACGGDVALRAEAENLLSRYTSARSYLASPPVISAAALVAEAHEAAAGETVEGRRIGAYRLVRQIGRGGMSRVYLAARADGAFEQQVALKVLRPGLDAEIDRNRFRAERQILATLDHPHIARLLDGGITDDGAPYLVLEHVDGQPIDAYCNEQSLDVAARLRLFVDVADATQHAHRRLVVHRDLKPSNIFVTRDGAVKLLDFGLAKLLEADSRTDAPALATHTANRWMTPEYAAPEQVRGESVTTLTDVYQLGAVLYQLLAGVPPFGHRLASVHELEERVLRHEPPRPRRRRRMSGGVRSAATSMRSCSRR